ncbi:MAG: prephenate dehydratase [Desulfonauticus sp.]|nr:prephenate dehydratase [Desulfonauticus sp.]
MSSLEDIRKKLNEIDQNLVELLNKRAELSLEVGKIKAQSDDLVFKPFREREILKKIQQINPGPLPSEHLVAIYREILSSSRRLQRPQVVLFLGPEGTFSHLAALEYLGQSVEFRPKNSIEGIFQGISCGEAELGIIPLENSLQGSVGQSLDLFMRYEVFIQAELYYQISHNLLSLAKDISEIKKVYSHPQALEQCSTWLRLYLPEADLLPEASTAKAAKRVTQEQDAAAIGNYKLASLFNLNILASHIEDLPDNWTRFLIIAARPSDKEGKEKTSLVFTLADKPGALLEALKVFAREGINLKKLESRPLKGEKWKYVFFADVECDLTQEQYKNLIQDLKNYCYFLRVLGSYPKGEYINARF